MRKSDVTPQSHERAPKRVFREGELWYYNTREGRRGPFETEIELRKDLRSYVGTMEFIEDNAAELPEDLDCNDVTLVTMDTPRF